MSVRKKEEAAHLPQQSCLVCTAAALGLSETCAAAAVASGGGDKLRVGIRTSGVVPRVGQPFAFSRTPPVLRFHLKGSPPLVCLLVRCAGFHSNSSGSGPDLLWVSDLRVSALGFVLSLSSQQ